MKWSSLLLSFLVVEGAFAEEPETEPGWFDLLREQVEVTGFIKNETVYRIHHPHRPVKSESQIQLELEFDPSENTRLTAIFRGLYDPINRLERRKDFDAEPLDRIESDHRFEAELREFYIDLFFDKLDLRLGKQQVVWGKADGLRILDFINPQEFREFILDDFVDARIPLWMARADLYLGDWTLEFLWIPDFEPSRPAQPRTEYFSRLLSFEELPLRIRDTEEPGDGLSSSEAGFLVSRFWRGWDITANYFYTWEDSPIPFRQRNPWTGEVFVEPEHRRNHITGFTFSNAFGAFVLRGEFGATFNKHFVTDEPFGDGVTEKTLVNYVVGLDFTASTYVDWLDLASMQFFQQIILDHRSSIRQDEVFNAVSLLLQKDFLNETLTPQILFLYGINESDFLARFKIDYDLSDNWRIIAGVDLMGGDRDGFFGQFAKRDRTFMEVKYSF